MSVYLSIYLFIFAHLLINVYISGFKFSQLEMSKQKFSSFVLISQFDCFFVLVFTAEVVLSLLIESFEFLPSKKEIFWNMTGLVIPTVVGDDSGRPKLPMVVKLIQPNL